MDIPELKGVVSSDWSSASGTLFTCCLVLEGKEELGASQMLLNISFQQALARNAGWTTRSPVALAGEGASVAGVWLGIILPRHNYEITRFVATPQQPVLLGLPTWGCFSSLRSWSLSSGPPFPSQLQAKPRNPQAPPIQEKKSPKPQARLAKSLVWLPEGSLVLLRFATFASQLREPGS